MTRKYSRSLTVVLALASFGAAAVSTAEDTAPLAGDSRDKPGLEAYHNDVEPILEKHCYSCHGNGGAEGNLALDTLQQDGKLTDPKVWMKVLENLRAGIMPPRGEERLSKEDLATTEGWIKNTAFSSDFATQNPGRVTLRRLNRVEYHNAIRDLLGYDFNVEHELPPDDVGYGFDNIGDVLSFSPMRLEKYIEAALSVVEHGVPHDTLIIPSNFYLPADFVDENGRDGDAMSFYQVRTVSKTFTAPADGEYLIHLYIKIDGNDTPKDPQECRIHVTTDGEEFFTEQYAWADNNWQEYDCHVKWTKGEHDISFTTEPIHTELQQRTKMDFRIVSVRVDGPLARENWIHPPGYDKIYNRDTPPTDPAERREYATEVLERFASKAFRRPVSEETLTKLVDLAEATYSFEGVPFEQGIAQAITAVLASPKFLFHREEDQPTSAAQNVAQIDEYSLASRMSFALWRSIPDEELTALAAQNKLRENFQQQVERMLADPKAAAFVEGFSQQWLKTNAILDIPIDSASIMALELTEEEEQANQLAANNAGGFNRGGGGRFGGGQPGAGRGAGGGRRGGQAGQPGAGPPGAGPPGAPGDSPIAVPRFGRNGPGAEGGAPAAGFGFGGNAPGQDPADAAPVDAAPGGPRGQQRPGPDAEGDDPVTDGPAADDAGGGQRFGAGGFGAGGFGAGGANGFGGGARGGPRGGRGPLAATDGDDNNPTDQPAEANGDAPPTGPGFGANGPGGGRFGNNDAAGGPRFGGNAPGNPPADGAPGAGPRFGGNGPGPGAFGQNGPGGPAAGGNAPGDAPAGNGPPGGRRFGANGPPGQNPPGQNQAGQRRFGANGAAGAAGRGFGGFGGRRGRQQFDGKELTPDVRQAMKKEVEAYFGYVMREDRSVLDFIDSDYTFVDANLAMVYGIPDVTGAELQKVELPADSPRGGVITMGSVLTVTSNPTRTSPVKRGKWVLENILGSPTAPPPPDVPALEETTEHSEQKLTQRQALAIHRESPLCSSCHVRMDPLGLALENFNGFGRFREIEYKTPIDPAGELITGETFDGIGDLKQALADNHRMEYYRNLAGKMMTYATGRGMEYYDINAIDEIADRMEANGGSFSSLIMGVLESDAFQSRLTSPDMNSLTGAISKDAVQ